MRSSVLFALPTQWLPLAALFSLWVAGPLYAAGPVRPVPGTAASLTSAQPALLGSAPTDGGKLIGNAVVFLFGDLPASLGTPTAIASNETTKTPIATRSTSSCTGVGSARRCVVNVILMDVAVDHRLKVTVLGHSLTLIGAKGHPGDKR